jgi:MFS family permease
MLAMLTANGISSIGNSLSYIAIPWFVLVTTGSAARTGLTAVAGTLPLIVTGLFGGAFADRVGAKRAAILSDLASSAAVAAIPLLYLTVGLSFWQLLVLVFLGAVLDSPGYAARSSLYPDLVIQAGVALERGNASLQVISRVSQVFAPPLAGVLIAVMGARNVLWLDAVSFLISASVIATMIPAPAKTAAHAATSALSYIAQLKEGLAFIRADRVVLAMLLTSALGAVLAEPLYSVVLPVYARQVYGSAVDLGLLFSALGAGSILGNIIVAIFGHRLPRFGTFLVGYGVRALSFWILIGLPSLPILALCIIINATALEPANPLYMTIMQERVPPELRGRVFGAAMSLGAGAMPLGLVTYGFLLEGIGLRDTLWLLAAVNLLVPLSILLLPAWRSVGDRLPARGPELESVAA